MRNFVMMVTLFSGILFSNQAYALEDSVGFIFQETFEGFLCVGEKNPIDCQERWAAEKLSFFLKLTHPSANQYFLDHDLVMGMTGKATINEKKYRVNQGYFVIDDQTETEKLMYFYYGFTYVDYQGRKFEIKTQKIIFMDEPGETVWDDLTTMFVRRWQVFEDGTRLPAGVGIITLSQDPFTLGLWVNNIKSTNGTWSDDWEIRMMALDFFVFDRFNTIYDGHPL
ncbi:MAG TPA: hypothetical protein VJL87_01980 [Bdellovibrionota bacterium]|nr:hypothetical protein [Bdellovibrionota bacterium]